MPGGEPQLPNGVNLGEVFAGRYRLDAIIGWGAMGVVVAAHDRRLDIPVAVKLLVGALPVRSEAVARFVNEARGTARLRSEHVVRVSDVGVHETGVPYIVMERLNGRDLATVLRSEGPLPVERAVDHVLEACEAIDEAHRQGIVHRDLKPANLFLIEPERGRPTIKVLDFGIAKNMLAEQNTVDWQESLPGVPATEKRAILGSPFYMSPEQMESSGDVDRRTDIYALGITLFELVIGKPPYTGASLVQVYSRMTAPGEHAWKASLSEVSPDLVPIVGKCLRQQRDERYAGVADLSAELAPFGSDRSRVSARRIHEGPAATPGDTATLMSAPTPRQALASLDAFPLRARSTSRTPLLLGWKATATLALLAAGAVLIHWALPSPDRLSPPPIGPAPSPTSSVPPAAAALAPTAPTAPMATPGMLTPPPLPTATAASSVEPRSPSHLPHRLAGSSTPPTVTDASPSATAGQDGALLAGPLDTPDGGHDIRWWLRSRE